jgi:chromosome partitioning protein
MRRTLHLGLINRKGGVAKTTTTVNLAAALAAAEELEINDKNLKVLVVDLDTQASASYLFGFEGKNLSPSISDVLLAGVPIQSAVRKTHVENLSLITATDLLAQEERRLYEFAETEHWLRRVIYEIEEDYDIVLYDCPPSLGFVYTMVMLTCNHFIVPTTVEDLGIHGLQNMSRAIGEHRKKYPGTATMMGILLTKLDYRIGRTNEMEKQIREAYSQSVLETGIPINDVVARAQFYKETIFQHDPNGKSKGYQAYRALGKEIITKSRERGFLLS